VFVSNNDKEKTYINMISI